MEVAWLLPAHHCWQRFAAAIRALGMNRPKGAALQLAQFFGISWGGNLFLPSLCETLPIIQRLPVGASLRVMRGYESRKPPAVNLGSLH
jgi:hypothetical protein